MKKHINILWLFLLVLGWPILVNSQDNPDIKKELKNANKYFDNEDFKSALPLFLNIEKSVDNLAEIKYKIGVCYINTKLEREKSIPYLEDAIESKEFQVPAEVYLELGKLYHEKYDFEHALLNYNKFVFYADKNNRYLNFANRMIKACNNAVYLLSDSLSIHIDNIGEPVNTFFSEYSPYISADGSTLFFNKVTYTNKSYLNEGIKQDSIVDIMMSTYIDKKWSDPKKIIVKSNINNALITVEGITPDGQHLFININKSGNSDLYTCTLNGYNCDETEKLSDNINSPYWEGGISQTPDGSALYFSSSRPGGYGGKDIYKITKNAEGDWNEEAENLGPAINTYYDETSPFIHPDKKTLFYSSKGHMAIGGFDIFKSVYNDGTWSITENLGYPINTTKDEMYFVLSANGKAGYFSSSVNNKYENHDIYKVTLKESIPLTLVKGIILAGSPPKPTGAKIKVIDKETNERIKYIYNPNPITGKYLMIFPPGKNYDMIIEAPGFLPRLINIYIPDQTYFFELYQEIILSQINKLGRNMGEEIVVNNTFYDIYKSYAADSIKKNVDTTENKEKDYDQLLKLIEDIISTTDSIGIEILDQSLDLSTNDNPGKTSSGKDYNKLFEMVEEAINTTDSVSLVILDRNTLYDEKSSQKFYYAENKEDNNLVKTVVDGDTIFTTPGLSTENEDQQSIWPTISKESSKEVKEEIEKKKINIINSKPEQRKIIYTGYVFFDSNKSNLKSKYQRELNQIASLIVNNENIGIEVLGYTDSRGEDDVNFSLSNERSATVFNYLNEKGVSAQKAILKGMGESLSKEEHSDLDRKFNRRVEIRVFELIEF